MIKLDFTCSNIVSQFENPFVSALFITCIVMIICFFMFDCNEMYDLFQFGVLVFLLNLGAFYLHFKFVKNKFSKDVVNANIEETYNRVVELKSE